jgi:undecaprenyl-diphosphatase
MAALVWLTLGIVIARTQQRQSLRVFVVAISVAITLLVGVSRVYLGVHWPTDVLAGWTLGGAWAVLFWLIAVKVDRRDA